MLCVKKMWGPLCRRDDFASEAFSSRVQSSREAALLDRPSDFVKYTQIGLRSNLPLLHG
jgi:hypothetical protein